MDKDARMQQYDEIGEKKHVESKLSTKSKEHVRKGCEEKKNGEDRNETATENEWLTPKRA